ncbi:MAG: CGNR zinc finger domain-containing protein [Chlamydiota bacterium]
MAEPEHPDPLCVRFVNTVDWRDDASQRVDKLGNYSGLVHWAREAGAIEPATANKLLQEAHRSPAAANGAFVHAISVREALAGILAAAANQRQAAAADLQRFNAALAESGRHLRLASAQGRFHSTWDSDDRLERLLWPVVRSAADLLTSGDLERLRICEGEGCGWFFMDTTRNRSRRWCNMAVCGNRAKVKRFYERHKAQ